MRKQVLRAAMVTALLAILIAPAAVFAQSPPSFGQPNSRAVIGEPLTLTSTISGTDITAVDVALRLAGHETSIIVEAEPIEPPGTWQVQQEIDISSAAFCTCIPEAPSPPNTRFEYQFRVRGSDGGLTLGPVAAGVVEDARFEWRTLEQGHVIVHWYAGDDAFAADVAQTANGAVDRASELLGVTMTEPVDFFVYDTQQALLEAVSPNRENIAGQFNSAIQTMFAHVPADQSAGEYAGEVIRHELTHWVFDEATENPYHAPPRWLDEGVAVYLSAGYTPYWRAPVDVAVADNTLIPIQGLRGLFPSTDDGFFLGYGEAVAAVDFFVRTHGEPQLWELVNSYAEGLSDDDAFTRATGDDVEAFNTAWFASLGLVPPGPAGPQPAPPGREPAEWNGTDPGSTAPPAGPGSTSAPAPATTQPQTPVPISSSPIGPLFVIGFATLIIVAGVIGLIIWRQYSRSKRPPMPPSGPFGGPPGPPPGPPPF